MSALQQQIESIAKEAKKAAHTLACSSTAKKNELLENLAILLEASVEKIQKANAEDLRKAEASGLSKAMLDRLTLTDSRIRSMVKGVRDVIRLPDPIGETTKAWTQPNGMAIQRVRVPIGVIGIIYESRPNVTIDSSILCLKTGNVTILRGGSEAFHSNKVLVYLVGDAAEKSGLPREIVSFIDTTDRAAIPILCEQDKYIDLMIPRGGYGLIETVVKHARMPVIKHFNGICHVYVHAKADFDMAEKIIINAKCQRPGVCNAAETLLIDHAIAKEFGPRIIQSLRAKGVKVLADEETGKILGETFEAPESWSVEYLDLILAVKVVKDLDEAVSHVETYGSHHSDTIVTGDKAAAEKFLAQVDSSAVYWNASTRFTDGGEFGFGAEIGISTDKIHARGPMALEELTSYKYVVRGNGQIRE